MSNEVSAQAVNRSGLLRSEDWWAVWLGLFIVVLGAGQIWHVDLLGWAAKFGVWIIVWSIYHLNDPRVAVASGAGKVSKREIWERFPKFIIGFVLALVVIFAAGWLQPGSVDAAKAGAGQANLLRAVFFGLCFFSIGLVTNVRKLWKSGLGRVIGVYAVALVGFIIWVGLFISYIFYHGIVPPTL